MVAVERLKFYSNVEMEGVGKGEKGLVVKPDTTWPSRGVLEFKSVTMRYRPELPLVLKGVSLSISENESVGICGRTGAGRPKKNFTSFCIEIMRAQKR